MISARGFYIAPIIGEPRKLKVEFRHGPRLYSTLRLRSHIVTTLFEIGRSADAAEKLSTAATTGAGHEVDARRRLIERATRVEITIEAVSD